jgi:hypothetical protein
VEVPLSVLTSALGMSTARWAEFPAELVPVASLTPTQTAEPDLWSHARGNTTASGDPCVHVVDLAGVRYLQDGHHRLARAVRDGQTVIAARVLRVSIRGAAA